MHSDSLNLLIAMLIAGIGLIVVATMLKKVVDFIVSILSSILSFVGLVVRVVVVVSVISYFVIQAAHLA